MADAANLAYLDSTVIVAFVSGVFTLIGTLGGIVAGNKMTSFRLERLEQEVKEHNQVIERTYALEKRASVIEERLSSVNHRIEDLEHDHK